MHESEIYKLFNEAYNQKEWQGFLAQTFAGNKPLPTPEPLIGINDKMAANALRLGNIILNENGIERAIAVFEVTLNKGIVLERNRVGLRNLLRKYWKDIDAAFIVYHTEKSDKWRFTYVSELTGWDAEGNFQKTQTEPKRYTYVLGKDESVRTAAQRFARLTSNATLEDVQQAFSVEKLSKEFFATYKQHYDDLCDVLEKQRSVKSVYFNGDDKAIRDFVKKLLGRIVFLYFIQKKGWLGVPMGGKWGDGDLDFLSKLFQNADQKYFYSTTLATLFFDTLNKERKGDIIELIKGQPCRIPYLNGGLFEEENPQLRNIPIPADFFAKLFAFFDQYNFTIYEDDPNDHTVAVDPEMLGHLFENLLEDNKDKGAFYTPKEIVHYMCQESLIEYLSTWFENKGYEVTGYLGFDNLNQPCLMSANEARNGQMVLETPLQRKAKRIDRQLIEKLLKKMLDDDDKKMVQQHADELNAALDNVKICDPAIGSGAFPMGLLQEIFIAKQTLWHFAHGDLKDFPASDTKLNIIQNSIYGVDIEKGAVDIARLRFWLSLIVDEETPKPLPNLDYKIVVGNSLVSKYGDISIEVDWNRKQGSVGETEKHLKSIEQGLKSITAKQKYFYQSKDHKDKSTFKAQIRDLKIGILINQLSYNKATYQQKHGRQNSLEFAASAKDQTKNAEIEIKIREFDNALEQLKTLKKNDQPFDHFDWKLDFPEVLNELVNPNPGFDIVIGNPPYIKEYTNRDAFEGFRHSPYYKGKMDIWYGFACKMLDLLKPKGIESFIAQNNWITSAGASVFRDKVLSESEIRIFTDFGNYKVFESAGIQTMIYILQKTSPKPEYVLKYSLLREDKISSTALIEFLNFNRSNDISEKYLFTLKPSIVKGKLLTFNDETSHKLLFKIQRIGNVLLTETEVGQGIVFPQDFVNKKSKGIIKNNIEVGDGIFALSKNELKKLNVSSSESKIIKPYFTTEELERYYANPENKLWIIYTGSEFKNPKSMQPYPNLKKHLDRFKEVITSDNKPYGLHRARDERFFKGESIIALRKCSSRPSFTYTNFDCYVSATFYVIQTKRLDMKYLTALLNSKVIEYWLRHKGKMQGNNFQVDKEPLLGIPLIDATATQQKVLSAKVDKILQNKQSQKPTTDLEQQIDNLVYRLYDLSYDEVKIIDPDFALSAAEYAAIEL